MEESDALAEARKLIEQGSLLEASGLLKSELDRDPRSGEAWWLMARIARLAENMEMAERMIAAALGANEQLVDAWLEKALIHAQTDRPAEARRCYERALEIDSENLAAHLALGDAYAAEGQLHPALDHFEMALAAAPAEAETYNKLAMVLDRLGRFAEAERALEKCLELQPHHVQGLIRLGNLRRDRHQPSRAKSLYEQALKLRPNDPYILANLANALMDFGDAAAALQTYQRSLAIYADQPTARSNYVFTLHYVSGIEPRQIIDAHVDWNKRHASSIEPLGPFEDHVFSDDRPLRVGFVSGDLRNHPVGRFAEVLFQHLDPKEITPFAYHSATLEDEVTLGIRRHAAGWRSFFDVGEKQAAMLTRADKIDILLDLSGHTSGNRIRVFPYRAAPLQISTWVYPGTTGLESIDYRLTDPFADPIDEEGPEFPEKLARLPRVSWIYQAPRLSPNPVPAPCLQGRPFSFGCLNNPNKISTAAIELWSDVLKKLPGATLTLLSQVDPEHAEDLQARFAKHGVKREQLVLRPKASIPTYLEYHNAIDLMFDPFPYNGCTTTCDSLWMGVPVLTLAGNYYVSRQGISFLSNLGMTQCIAASKSEFIEKAIAFARSPEATQQLRDGLRDRLQQSPLMNYTAYARDLTELLRQLWRQRCAENCHST